MSLAFATPKAQNYSHDNWDSNLTHFARKEAMKYFSLRGRRSKGKGEGIRARDHARGRRGTPVRKPLFLPSRPLIKKITKITQCE